MIIRLRIWACLMLAAGCAWFACSSSDQAVSDAGPDAADGLDGGEPGPDCADGADAGEMDACQQQVFEDVGIPMRDGKALAAWVRHAADPACRLPAVVLQTPYNKENARSLWFSADDTDEPLFSNPAYAFVVVDWRGFFGSKEAAVDSPLYGQDGYDTVEWIAAQSWCDGRVGTWGVSALCQQQYRTAVQKPPHLAAAVPIFCQMNTTYPQYYPGGVLRREYFDFINAYYGGGDLILQHPYHDGLWQIVERTLKVSDIAVPMLVVAGWYDLYDTGTLDDFSALQQGSDPSVRDKQRLLVGPWFHFAAGGETVGAGRPLDDEEMLYYDSDKRIQQDSLAFFDKHLRGVPSAADGWAAARWTTGGVAEQESGERWPPIGAGRAVFYPAADGVLAADAPAGGRLDFAYDPDDPSPTVGGSTLLPSLKHGPREQDDVIARADVLVFVSAPLAEPLRLRGAVQAVLQVSTGAADTDFAIRLTDVDPDGRQLLIADGIQRLKLRDDQAIPSQVQPGRQYEITVTTTNELGYTFAAGQRVGLIVSSSNYPRFARNPNNGDDFYTDAASSQSATNSLYPGATTRLILPAGE